MTGYFPNRGAVIADGKQVVVVLDIGPLDTNPNLYLRVNRHKSWAVHRGGGYDLGPFLYSWLLVIVTTI